VWLRHTSVKERKVGGVAGSYIAARDRRQELARGQRVTTSPHTIVINDFKLICIAPIRLAIIPLALRLTAGKITDTFTTLLGINQSAPGELGDVSGMMRAIDLRKHSALSTGAHPMAVSFAS
jgi:hypothetical protein